MRLAIIAILFISMIGLVSAIYEGQNISQQQLDNFNVSTITKGFLECQSENNTAQTQQFFYVDYSCFNMKVIEEGVLYQVYREYYSAPVQKIEWQMCRALYTKPICRDWFMANRVMPHVEDMVQATRLFVSGWQTNSFWDEIQEWLEGLQI